MTIRCAALFLLSLFTVAVGWSESILGTLVRAAEASEPGQIARFDTERARLVKAEYLSTRLPSLTWDSSTTGGVPGLVSLGFSDGLGNLTFSPSVGLTQTAPGGGRIGFTVMPTYSRTAARPGGREEEYYSAQVQLDFNQPLGPGVFLGGQDLDDRIADLVFERSAAKASRDKRAATRWVFNAWKAVESTGGLVDIAQARSELAQVHRERIGSLTQGGTESVGALADADRSLARARWELQSAVLRNKQARELFRVEAGFLAPLTTLEELEGVDPGARPEWMSSDQGISLAGLETSLVLANESKRQRENSPDLRLASSVRLDSNSQVSISMNIGIGYSSGQFLRGGLQSEADEIDRLAAELKRVRLAQKAAIRAEIFQEALNAATAKVTGLRVEWESAKDRESRGRSMFADGALKSEDLTQFVLEATLARSELRSALWDRVEILLFPFEEDQR